MIDDPWALMNFTRDGANHLEAFDIPPVGRIVVWSDELLRSTSWLDGLHWNSGEVIVAAVNVQMRFKVESFKSYRGGENFWFTRRVW